MKNVNSIIRYYAGLSLSVLLVTVAGFLLLAFRGNEQKKEVAASEVLDKRQYIKDSVACEALKRQIIITQDITILRLKTYTP